MIFKPSPLSRITVDDQELVPDKKSCRKIGPCGVGKKALYLNSFFIDRKYYVPFQAIQRVFKRVAMSQGGFSGKGMFASMAYLVVEFDHGKQKQCNFKHESEVDDLLALLAREQPQIKRVSAQAEQRLAAREAQRAEEERSRPTLSAAAQQEVDELQRAIDYLEQKPELSDQLSKSAKRKRAYQCTSPSYRWAAMAITILGLAALAYGIFSFLHHGTFAIYFTLFGLAAIFTFAGFSVLPTAKNNKKSVLQYDEQAQQHMEAYLSKYPAFPVPVRYAHPIVLKRMQRVIIQGRTQTAQQALEIVKADLKALNADVQVSQEEHDEVVAIKPMFLNAAYE